MTADSLASLHILSFDIGGSHLKASVVDSHGRLLFEEVSVETPNPCPPETMLAALLDLVKPLPPHNRIAIGFPGVVHDGHVITAPNLGTKDWAHFPLAYALEREFGCKVLMVNDAELQGLAVIKRKGLELVLTLGTGAGTGLFLNGAIMPHLELAHHPIHGSKTYDEYLGHKALKKAGAKHWNKRIAKVIPILHTLLNYDHLYIGGGNAKKLTIDLPPNVTIVSNVAGVEGGGPLWRYAGA